MGWLPMPVPLGSVAAVAGIDAWIKGWWGSDGGDRQRQLRAEALEQYEEMVEAGGHAHILDLRQRHAAAVEVRGRPLIS